MLKEVSSIIGIYRYPVKSMAGQQLASAEIGWHGLAGDRRFALMRQGVTNGFPWLTASKLPQLVLYTPLHKNAVEQPDVPTHIRTPDGRELELHSETLKQELSNAHGAPVDVMQLSQGIFDEAPISIISIATIKALEQAVGIELDIRRFRPNLLIKTISNEPFEEHNWVGKTIRIGNSSLHIYMQDIRCSMINIDPDSGESDSRILKTVAQNYENCAGVYATITGTGRILATDKLYLEV